MKDEQNLNYESFVRELIDGVNQEFSPEYVQVSLTTYRKINTVQDALKVKFYDRTSTPTIRLDGKYQMYLGGYSLQDVIEDTIEDIRDVSEHIWNVPDITPESARQNLYCAVINAEKNQDMLRELPHERMGDLAIIPRYRICDEMSFIVSKDLCGIVQMTPEEIMECARRNTDQQPCRIETMAEVMQELLHLAGRPEEEIQEQVQFYRNIDMYRMTNASGIDGAAMITSSRALAQAFDRIGQDYYILPSSRHEVVLLPEDLTDDTKLLQSLVEQINRDTLLPGDYLSDRIYRYDSRTQTVSMIDGKELLPEDILTEHLTIHKGRSH